MKTIEERLAKELMFFKKYPNKRCKDARGCKYDGATLGLKTKGCLIGRMLPKKTRQQLDRVYGTISIGTAIVKTSVTLPTWLCLEKGDMLDEFQELHDSDFYWRGGKWGGQSKLKNIIDKFGLNPEPFREFL